MRKDGPWGVCSLAPSGAPGPEPDRVALTHSSFSMICWFSGTADKTGTSLCSGIMRLERKDLFFYLFNIKKKKLFGAKQFNKYYSCRWQEEMGLLNKKTGKANTEALFAYQKN